MGKDLLEQDKFSVQRALRGQSTAILNNLLMNDQTGLPKVTSVVFTKLSGTSNRSLAEHRREILSGRKDPVMQNMFEAPVRADKCPVWTALFEDEKKKPYMAELQQKVRAARNGGTVYPSSNDVFNAFKLTHYNDVRVVILGQDPYHNGAAHGLAFSALGSVIPKSLQNIFREIKACYPDAVNQSPNLTPWAEQGVLLLNTCLTVNAGKANSHSQFGWMFYIEAVMRKLAQRTDRIIFVLWGNHAQSSQQVVFGGGRHTVLKAAHPSPFSAESGFFGCKHFLTINEQLSKPINWNTYA